MFYVWILFWLLEGFKFHDTKSTHYISWSYSKVTRDLYVYFLTIYYTFNIALSLFILRFFRSSTDSVKHNGNNVRKYFAKKIEETQFLCGSFL